MNKFFRMGLGILLSLFFLWLSFRNIDRGAFRDALQHVEPKWVGLALLIYLSGHFLRAVRWRLLLSPLAKVSAFSVFPVLMFGFLVNNLLPGRIGEVAKSMAAARRFSIPTASVLGTVALERLGDLVGLLSIMIVALRVFPPARNAFPTVLGSFLGVGVSLVLGFFILKKVSGRFSAGSWPARIVVIIGKVFEGI